MRVHVCMCACVCVCACVRACVRVCVCVRATNTRTHTDKAIHTHSYCVCARRPAAPCGFVGRGGQQEGHGGLVVAQDHVPARVRFRRGSRVRMLVGFVHG